MISEKEILMRLEQGQFTFPPISIQIVSVMKHFQTIRVDAIIRVSWDKQNKEFAVNIKSLWTPKIIREALFHIKATAQKMGHYPMIIVPYLSEEALQELEREGVSGLDLCGNGIVMVQDRLRIYRTGNRNLFSSSAPIKNIYRKNTSMVGREFLVRKSFNKVTELREVINLRDLYGTWKGQPMSLSTISKALKGLEGDLIVGRKGNGAYLLQPEKLLDLLAENYKKPKIGDIVNWKFPSETSEEVMLKKAFLNPIPAVVTGLSSVSRYAVMQSGETMKIYCPNPRVWLAGLPGTHDDRFPSISVVQTDEASVYYDARSENGILWASAIQCYLELQDGDKREQETARQVRVLILDRLKERKE